MFALNLRRVKLANGRSSGGQGPLIDSGRISIKVHPPKGLALLLSLPKDPIRPTAKRVRQHPASQLLNGLPSPALLGVALDTTPPFLNLRRLDSPPCDGDRVRTTALHSPCVYLREAGRFF